MEAFVTQLILYVAIPLWMLAGIADWCCHRATHIELNSGLRESALHALMLAEMGLPIAFALFFEINALFFLVAVGALLAHEATALWDVSYAHKRRYLSPFEQHVHSFLELVPLFIMALLAALHREQFLALFGFGGAAPDFALRLKAESLPTAYVAVLVSAVVLLQLLPYGEELLRCHRGRKRRVAAAP